MPAPKTDKHKAALALAQWALTGFTFDDAGRIAKQHGTTDRTLRRWREKLKTDAELSTKYELYLKELVQPDNTAESMDLNHWTTELNFTLNAALKKQAELIAMANKVEHLEHVNSAVSTLTEIQFARDVLFNNKSAEQNSTLSEDGGDYSEAYN